MIAVTSRDLCREPLPVRVGRIASAGPELIVLREKDLPHDALLDLAAECLAMCSGHGVVLSVNSAVDVAEELGTGAVHLPMDVLRDTDVSGFDLVGASVHSAAEAVEAEALGADYLIAGHVFATSCKSSEPRGTGFLSEVCGSVGIPVYAIGGISPDNVDRVISAGAAGVCAMSSLMATDDPEGLVRALSRDMFVPRTRVRN